MENSDSDNDSDCFESAEESLDDGENGKKEKNCKIKKNFVKCESEVVEPVSDTSDSVVKAEGENVSNNSLAYRKRPERLMRLTSKSPPKVETPTKVTRPSDSIFKTDKIGTDVFFQDITSNLSKNINKSLNTLHQTSSNVKDLILSSLPVVSVDEKEGFSYDDSRSVFPASVDECKPQETAQNQVLLNEKPEKLVDIVPSEKNKKVESHKEEIINEDYSGIKEERIIQVLTGIKEEKIIQDLSGVKEEKIIEVLTGFKEEKIFEDSSGAQEHKIVENVGDSPKRKRNVSSKVRKILGRGKEKELSRLAKTKLTGRKLERVKKEKKEKEGSKKVSSSSDSEKESEAPDCINKETTPKTENSHLNNFVAETKDVEVSKEKFSDKILNDENFIKSEISSQNTFDQITKESFKISETNDETKLGIITEETYCQNDQTKPLQPKLVQVSSDDWDDFVPEEEVEEIALKDSKSDWDDFDAIQEESAIPQQECNFEELKTVLKQMVPEVDDKKKETTEVAGKSKDGWDDFDFSDNEIENRGSEVERSSELPTDKQKALPLKSEIEVDVQDLKVSGKSVFQNEESEKEKAVKSDVKNFKVTGKGVFQKEEKTKEKEVEEEKGEKDDWGWENWDEDSPTHNQAEEEKKNTTEEEKKNTTEEEKKNTTEEKKKNTTEEDFFNESRWSGWDSFGVKPEEKQGNWNIGSWGVNMLLNKATAVTQGISSALEAGLGAPDPKTLARIEKLEKEKLKEKGGSEVESEQLPPEVSKKNSLTDVNLFPVFGITSLVADVTSKIVEHSKIQEIGSKVLTGGLDTLETFGKKTMEVLQEGDPGLKNKRALLMGSNKPVLSQVLREAREKADRELRKVEEKEMAKKCHFETLFDDFQGMVHLEALEMLSRQCELKLEQIRSTMNPEEQEELDGILEEVEQLCALDEYDPNSSSLIDFKISLNMAVESLKDEISVKQIIQIYEDVVKWFQTSSETKPSATIIHQKTVSTLAELTAAIVHQFHKAGELLSVKECRKTVEEVDALSRMTGVLCTEIQKLCEKFIALSKSNNEAQNASSVVEKVDVVMKNSTSYIRQAFNLLIPVVQTGAAV